MRWFWLLILAMVLLTGGLYAQRVRTAKALAQAQQARAQQTQEDAGSSRSRRRSRPTNPNPTPKPAPEPAVSQTPEPVQAEPIVEVEPEPTPDSGSAAESSPEPSSTPAGSFLNVVDVLVTTEPTEGTRRRGTRPPSSELKAQSVETDVSNQERVEEAQEPTNAQGAVEGEPDLAGESASQADEVAAGPSYEILADGSIKVLATGTFIIGAGTPEEPFVLDWATLRSLSKIYKPKEGKEELPDWLYLLDEKHVQITGNTLVPVIATTTRELLVMQNPWDGCCIGIPPSPYDAIEVVLNHDVDFGSSAVGYGTVDGIFLLDPYVVDGWLLGLYIIEDGKYRSGEGMVFPEF